MHSLIFFLALGLLSFSQPGQPPRDTTRPVPAGTGVLTGRITVIGRQPLPVRRARVILESGVLEGPRSTTADTDGRYRFADLPPGTYRVKAEKSGFVGLAHGARRYADPGTPIALKAGAAAVADIALPRGAAIEGRIVNEAGEPRQNVVVSAARLTYGPYGRRPAAVRDGRTDDLGRYRIHSLPAGTYYVMGAADPMSAAMESRAPGARRPGIARAFYPGTPNVTDAERVTVAAGQDASGIDFATPGLPLADVAVRVVGSSGGKQVNVSARLQAAGAPPGEVVGIRLPGGDNFQFIGVPPGDYWVMGVSLESPGAAPEFAIGRLTVAGRDVKDYTLTTEKAAVLAGRVEVEGGPFPAVPALKVVAHAAGVELPSIAGVIAAGDTSATVGPDGSFTFASLFGPRVFRIPDLPAGWALAGVWLDDAPITDAVTDFKSTPAPRTVRVVITKNLGRLTGKVTGPAQPFVPGARVVVFPEDERQWMFRSRFVRSAVADPDGTFSIDGLLPGRYLACAMDDLGEGDWFDPDVLRRLKVEAPSVVIAGNDTFTLTLKLRLPL